MPKTVTATRQLKAAPERVFRAWTDPADVKRWFKPARLIMNPQVDGLWHTEVEWEGKRWPHYGRYTRLERPRLFEQTWMSEAPTAWRPSCGWNSKRRAAAPRSG